MNGVITFLCGDAFAELLAVSLWTLRQHCDFPVTIFVTDRNICEKRKKPPRPCTPRQAAKRIAQDERLGPIEIKEVPLANVPWHAAYCTKRNPCSGVPN